MFILAAATSCDSQRKDPDVSDGGRDMDDLWLCVCGVTIISKANMCAPCRKLWWEAVQSEDAVT